MGFTWDFGYVSSSDYKVWAHNQKICRFFHFSYTEYLGNRYSLEKEQGT